MVALAALGLVVAAALTDLAGGGRDEPSTPTTGQSSTTLVPEDVAEPRPSVDLAEVPLDGDVVDVGRWWAATYTAYVGFETPEELAARLAPVSVPALVDELAGVASAISYDVEPLEIEGVSHRTPLDDPAGTRLRVSVETPGALVIYDLLLVEDPAGWRVSEATRL